jgi:hypothetical protein
MLPLFTDFLQALPATARQDKIEMVMNLGTIEGSTNQIDRFRKALSPQPYESWAGGGATHGWIFRRPGQQPNTYRRPLKIRRRAKVINGYPAPKPLFQGHLNFTSYYHQAMDDLTRSHLSLQLSANPTTFARYSPPRPNGSPPINEAFGNTPPAASNGEFSLNGKPNWLLAGALDTYYNATRWKWNVRRYFVGLRNHLRDELRTAAGMSGTVRRTRQNDPAILVNKVETYWEAITENPLAVVRTLAYLLSDFAKNRRETTYAGNSVSLRYHISNGVELCIYAKTNQRIRFEVRHDLKELPSGSVQRNAGVPSTILPILDVLKEKAAVVVNAALAHARGRNQIPASHINEALLMVRIGRIVKDDSLAITFIEILRAHGGILPDNTNIPLRRALERLQNHGVLVFSETSQRWIPAPEYAYATRTLQSRQDLLLVVPKRKLNLPMEPLPVAANVSQTPPIVPPKRKTPIPAPIEHQSPVIAPPKRKPTSAASEQSEAPAPLIGQAGKSKAKAKVSPRRSSFEFAFDMPSASRQSKPKPAK